MIKTQSKKISVFSFAVATLFALPFTGMAQTTGNSSTTMNQNQMTSSTSLSSSNTSSTTLNASSTKIILMKHLCNANIKNSTQFEALGAGTTTLGRFIAEEVACPTTALPGNVATAGTISAPRTNFDFRILSGGTEQGLNGATYVPRSLCETDVKIDMNNDGVISAGTCIDAAHYVFDLGNTSSGTVRITENVSPANNHMVALRFTPQELMPNTDSLSLVSTDVANSVITLNPAADNDRMIMLHIFNIQTGTSTTGTATSTTSTTTTSTNTTSSSTNTAATKIMVMKHLCNPSIKNAADFEAIEAGKAPVARLAATVLACPTTGLPGDAAVSGTVSSPRTNFNFKLTGNGMSDQMLSNATFMPQKLCESDINVDVNGDGMISGSTCLDISHYEFNSTAGHSDVVEINNPAGTHMGALRFTPNELAANNDSSSLVQLDIPNSTIHLNTASDTDRSVMLHVYNFVDTGTTTETGTTGGTNNNGQAQSSDAQVQRLELLIQRLLSLLGTMGVNITNINMVNILNGSDDGNNPFIMSRNSNGIGHGHENDHERDGSNDHHWQHHSADDSDTSLTAESDDDQSCAWDDSNSDDQSGGDSHQ